MPETSLEASQPALHKGWVDRAVGLDAMRALAMLFVVVLHISRFSGDIMANDNAPYHQDAVDSRLWGFMGVPMFSLLTGYLCVGHPVRSFKLLLFDMQVRFYVVLDLIFQKAEWNKQALTKVVFPVLSSQFWYAQRYMMLQFVLPILNHGIEPLSTTALCIASGGIFAFLSWGPYMTVAGAGWNTEENYSYFFLIGLYIIGATIKRVTTKWKPQHSMVGAACVLVANYWLFRYITRDAVSDTVLNHCSFATLVGATAMLVLFSKVHVQVPQRLSSLLNRAAQNVFSVYMIHMSPGFFDLLWKNYRMIDFVLDKDLVRKLVGFCCIIFAKCWLVDWARQLVFWLLLELKCVQRFCATKIDPFINQLNTQHQSKDKPLLP